MTTAQTNKLEGWRVRLNASGLPVFSRTIREINSISTSQRSSAQDLSDAIGHDASMAARVIQIANSPAFNLQHREIDTISTAVVMLGFDAVRDLVITVSVIEEMLRGDQHARVGKHMARAFHAAAQARSFAVSAGDKPEEVFVGALLKQVGEMAFWSRADVEAEAIEALLQGGAETQAAEREVLGFELNQLSRVLAEDWSLGDLVTHVIDGKHSDEPIFKHVQFGHELATKVELFAWDSPQVREVIQRVAKYLDMPVRAVEELGRHNMDVAASIAERFGVTNLGETLKTSTQAEASQSQSDAKHAETQGAAGSVGAKAETGIEFDAIKLLEVIDTVSDGIDEGASRDELMPKVVEGLAYALGYRYAYFALYTADRTSLKIKYSAGVAAKSLVKSPWDPKQNKFFADVLGGGKLVTVTQTKDDAIWHLGGAASAVAVRLAGRAVGVLYGEVAAKKDVSNEQRRGLKQLGHQIALILSKAR